MLLFHWLMFSYLFYSMARTKVTPKMMKGVGRGGFSIPERQGELGWRRDRGPFPSTPPIPSQEALTHERGGEEADGGGREVGGGSKRAGGCGKVSVVIANPTVGPDGCRGGAICFGSGGASQEEALTYHGKQSPPELIPPGWKGQEDQEVPAWHSCSLRDLAVPKEHWAPCWETPLLMISPQDSPRSWQVWLVLPREHHHMPAGSCRSTHGWSHGRCQPLCHTCKKGDNYAQRHSVSPLHLGTASKILKAPPNRQICWL